MKKIFALPAFIFLMLIVVNIKAQNIFPSTGRAGIYTTSPAASLQVKGGARIGTLTNYVNIDSATGNLSLAGTAAYLVQDNAYAFRSASNNNIGLFFNKAAVQYEFRNTSASPVFYVGANSGNAVLTGTLKVGAYTLPATDGVNGQVLKTNGAGVLTWNADNNNVYTAGTGISIASNVITNSAPDKTVTLTGSGGTTVSGAYPNFTISSSTNSYYIITTNSNTGVGYQSLYSNTSGYNNTATGVYSLFSNLNGYSNTATGHQALFTNETGNNNTAYGESPLYSNLSGSFNTAIGSGSLSLNSNGSYNTAIGYNSLSANTYEGNLVAVGANALYHNGSGASQSNDGVANTAIGSSSLYSNTIGYNNTANGYEALYHNTTGYNNAAYGVQALLTNTTGIGNTALGVAADGYNGLVNTTVVGYYAFGTASNQVRIGSVGSIWGTDPISIGGEVGWSTVSDVRVKKNIKENVPGLAFINKLKPITFNVDNDAINKIIQRPAIKDKDGKVKQPSADEMAAVKAEEQIVRTGFIAQDVEKAAKSLNYDFSGVDAAKNDKDLYGLRYGDFVVPLVKAVQELSAQNDSLKNTNSSLQSDFKKQQSEINELRSMLLSIQQKQEQCSPCSAVASQNVSQSSIIISDASSLQQNIPNPFTNTTSINYSLPQKFSSAQIVITDKNGSTIKAINISGSGKGNLNIDASTLASGAYQYSLIVDGKLIATKQMALAK